MSDDWQVVEDALRGFQMPIAKAALARLREREAQIERKYRATVDWGDKALMAACEKERARAEAAEARVAELEAVEDKYHERVLELMARVARLEEALRSQMRGGYDAENGEPPWHLIARRALAHKEETP